MNSGVCNLRGAQKPPLSTTCDNDTIFQNFLNLKSLYTVVFLKPVAINDYGGVCVSMYIRIAKDTG